MADQVRTAQELVVQAGLKLVASGLVARTWGNISARVSDAQFAVTPKGRAYGTLTPDDIVLLNIADCSYEGNIKPSSEKGIHASVYRLRKDINFVIHTHQLYASVLSVLGEGFDVDSQDQELLGSFVPDAPYGISSTKKLARNAARTIEEHPESSVILLRSHGAVCFGRTMDEVFRRADRLERAAKKRILELIGAPSLAQVKKMCLFKHAILHDDVAISLGNSVRQGSGFSLRIGSEETNYLHSAIELLNSPVATLHASAYQVTKANCIIGDVTSSVLAVSRTGKTIRPYIDDVAQIIGTSIRSAASGDVIAMINKRNAVFLAKGGALCLGQDEADAKAVAMILEKECLAEILVALTGKGKPLGRLDCWLQRFVYQRKYSKLKNKE